MLKDRAEQAAKAAATAANGTAAKAAGKARAADHTAGERLTASKRRKLQQVCVRFVGCACAGTCAWEVAHLKHDAFDNQWLVQGRAYACQCDMLLASQSVMLRRAKVLCFCADSVLCVCIPYKLLCGTHTQPTER